MRYTAKTYLENQRKWGKINQMIQEINTLAGDGREQRDKIYTIFAKMTDKISSRKKELPIEIEIQGTKIKLGIFKGGICYFRGSGHKARGIGTSFKVIRTICENKTPFLNAIPNRNKKEIMEVLLNNLSDFSEGKRIVLERQIKKSVLFPIRKGEIHTFEEREIVKLVAEVSIDNPQIELYVVFDKGKEDRENHDFMSDKPDGYRKINDTDLSTNILKEQLYLDIWKLLIKVRRRTLKRKKVMSAKIDKIMKDLTPVLVAEEI